jgi:hypothetical protein
VNTPEQRKAFKKERIKGLLKDINVNFQPETIFGEHQQQVASFIKQLKATQFVDYNARS